MKKYFFNQIFEFKKDLNILSQDKNDVNLLVNIQKRLLNWHESLENFTHNRKKRLIHLSRLKKNPKNTKTTSAQIKKSIKICTTQLDDLKKFKIWARHLGNSIPHIYYDKSDLRAYSYSLNTSNLKELSGDLFGKEGFDLELEIFHEVTSKGYKLLLNDLTSIIRHGDIMVMEKDFPFLMEVKKNKATSKTAKRQVEHIKEIQNYLLTDQSTDIRGGDIVSKRINTLTTEETNKILINNNLEYSKKNGYCFSKIENGLFCLSHLSNIDYSEINMGILNEMEKPIIFPLNQFKNTEDHSLFYPYSLSINDPVIFSNFLCGQFFIYFFIDWKFIESKAKDKGINLAPISEFFLLEIWSEDDDIPIAHSYTLMKAICEFSSINWAIEELCNLYTNHIVKSKL